jgi:hypothetical protein
MGSNDTYHCLVLSRAGNESAPPVGDLRGDVPDFNPQRAGEIDRPGDPSLKRDAHDFVDLR